MTKDWELCKFLIVAPLWVTNDEIEPTEKYLNNYVTTTLSLEVNGASNKNPMISQSESFIGDDSLGVSSSPI